MIRLYRVLALAPLLYCVATAANLPVVVKKKDPINGDTVQCRELASFSFIRAPWKEAAELGVSPLLLHAERICENPRSGYVAFVSEFDELSAAERERIRRWLQQNYRPAEEGSYSPPTASGDPLTPRALSRMQRLEALYDLRDVAPEYRDQIKRIMAIVYKLAGDEDRYRARLRELVDSARGKLAASKDPAKANAVRTLLVEYHLRLGDTKAAERYLVEVAATKDRPTVIALWYRFGQHHFERGDFAEACRELRRAWNAPFLDARGHVDWRIDSVRSGIVELERKLPQKYRFIDADWEGKPNRICASPGR